MKPNFIFYLFLSFIAPVAVLIAAMYIVKAVSTSGAEQMYAYRYGFYSFLLSAACIEGRVRMGYRLKRTRIFWVHLSCAIPFFILLGVLGFVYMPSWITALELILFAVVLSTGVVLYTRGMRAEVFYPKKL